MTPDEILPLLRKNDRGTLVPCHVQPRASKTGVSGIYGTFLKVTLNAPPVDGKANAALCEFLAKKCGVPKSSVCVVSGDTSRDKTILIPGVEPTDAAQAICKK